MKETGLPYEELKGLVIDYIKKNGVSQYVSVCNGFAKYLVDNHYVDEPQNRGFSSYDSYSMASSDATKFREILWDLIIERIICIGNDNGGSAEWPWLSVTDYGNYVFESAARPIHDIDGILRDIKSDIANVDEIIIRYYSEAIVTYKRDSLLSSCVMLGCAAEKAVLVMYDAYAKWLEKRNEVNESKKFRETLANRHIAIKFDEMMKSIKGHICDIPKEITADLDLMIDSTFTIIRKNRNKTGHPTGESVPKRSMYAWLQVFNEHLRHIYKLINYFNQ